MRMHALVWVLAAGCGSVDATKRDAGADTSGDDSGGGIGDSYDVCTTWSATNFTPCTSDALPSVAIHVTGSGASINTTDGSVMVGGAVVTVPTSLLTQSGGVREIRLLSVSSLQVDANLALTITGDKPLLLAVHGDVTIAGAINLGGSATVAGPGGDDPFACASSKGGNGADSQDQADGGGGGGGGGFGVAGSAGGTGGGGGGLGGAASADATLSPLRGGCLGGTGGPNGSAGGGLPGGKGGGAIQISARGSISVTGTINAGGGGGTGAGTGGAGGGGAGGAIFLETGTGGLLVSATAAVCANGGSGGEGTGGGLTGVNGVVGSCRENFGAYTTDTAATGGTGGTGGFQNDPDGTPGGLAGGAQNNYQAGGGGGGAVGRIRFKSTNVAVDAASHVSPAHVN